MGPRMGFYKVENLYRPDNKLASGLVKVVRQCSLTLLAQRERSCSSLRECR